MRQLQFIMGMPIIVEIEDNNISQRVYNEIFEYFHYIDQKFSTYKTDSEIEKINRGDIGISEYSKDMKEVLKLSQKTKEETNGYFDIFKKGKMDPSGLVKGWAIWNAYKKLENLGYQNFYINAGGDIQTKGKNSNGEKWRVGIENPWNKTQIVKIIHLENKAIATSGVYVRGSHIYNPITGEDAEDIISVSVIGDNIYDADRFATAAFAMGKEGINFIQNLRGFEGYMIDKNMQATMTNNFDEYTVS